MQELHSIDSQSPVLVSREDSVGVIRLNRPEKRNALDLTMRQALAESFRLLTADEQIRAIVITGGDKVFAAGADLNLLVDKGPQQVSNIDLGQYWAPLANCPKPVIAAVSGHALGAGCELTLMCDIVVADSTTRLGQTECNVGIMPGAGGTQRLIRAVGKPVASLMLMTGEIITGERAYQSGLVSELVEDGKTIDRAMKLAQRAARMPPLALAAIKRSLTQGAELPLNEALTMENREFLLLFDTQDKTEGMRAFLEKRKPEFSGQ
ncbi:MAG: enoyl-CoA hydratase/isomerase family protein [Gammaproteobacteria bacterium]|nr:enoyl-CoA hydratase/isomerase family protein [Gammaproteobacteria bacterium]